MNVYIGMTVISLIFMYYAEKKYNRINTYRRKGWYIIERWKLYLFLAIIPSVLVAGLRYNVGTDYMVYLRTNHYIGSVFAGSPCSMEPIFRIMVEIGYRLNSTQIVFFEIALIFSFFSYGFIKCFSKNWTMSVVLLLITGTFSHSLNIMRQMAAVMICMYALKYAIDRKKIKYFLLILFAAGIHSIAIIFLIPYFLVDKMHFANKKGKIQLIMLIVGLYGISPYLYQLSGTILQAIGSKYAYYYGSSREMGASTAVMVICLIALLVNFIFVKDDINGNNIFVLYSLLACVVLAMRLPNCNRVAYLFIPSQIVLVPNLIEMVEKKSKKYLVTIIILGCYFSFWCYFFYKSNVSQTFPYQSIFTK